MKSFNKKDLVLPSGGKIETGYFTVNNEGSTNSCEGVTRKPQRFWGYAVFDDRTGEFVKGFIGEYALDEAIAYAEKNGFDSTIRWHSSHPREPFAQSYIDGVARVYRIMSQDD